MTEIKTFGSLCSGIEAASVAWVPLGLEPLWLSENAPFPSSVLSDKFPSVPNLGDMNLVPSMIERGDIESVDLICGGTPCQAFSFAGWQNGLNDDRGNLALKFVEIVEENDKARLLAGKKKGFAFWENVEGVLTDKTNAFGCLVSSLAGFDKPIEQKRWPKAGVIRGSSRNVAWRVLDAKYFGIPQQRKRLYVMATDKCCYPEDILFELSDKKTVETEPAFPERNLSFEIDGHSYEVFRAYTDCLYSAYGTKWNGNAAATNGSLFVVQDKRIRRLMPLECERLMGFPDGFTDISNAKKTSRYQATGNSWVVPVISELGRRILKPNSSIHKMIDSHISNNLCLSEQPFLDMTVLRIHDKGQYINSTVWPTSPVFGDMKDIVAYNEDNSIFISPVGCSGILRRCKERGAPINQRLKEVLESISSEMSPEEIEKRSRVQHRGRFSIEKENPQIANDDNNDSLTQQDLFGSFSEAFRTVD